MKRYFMALVVACLFVSQTSLAAQGQGTISEVKICSSSGSWRTYVFFKLSDGSWFGTYANYYVGSTAGDPDENFMYSTIMTAFTSDLNVNVVATNSALTLCGETADMINNGGGGDYIRITK